MLDKNQLSNCDTQGQLFILATEKGYSCSEFIRKFMKSKVAQKLDAIDENPYTYSHEIRKTPGVAYSYTAEEIMDMILKEEKISKATESIQSYESDVMYWIGWTYRFWHYHDHCRPSIKIWRKVNGQTMRKAYKEFHTLSPEETVDSLLKLSMSELWQRK